MNTEYNQPRKPEFYVWDQAAPGNTPSLESYKTSKYWSIWLEKLKDEQESLQLLAVFIQCYCSI